MVVLLALLLASTELVEVFAINTMAPFILNKRVIPLLLKVHIVKAYNSLGYCGGWS
jgi:hypothetical protein